jgi:hypothetical protein
MTDPEVINTVRAHAETHFPMNCTNCAKPYRDLHQFLLETTHVGKPISYDAEENDWRPKLPIGTLAQFNCQCGTTLTLGSPGMPLSTLWRLMWWLRQRHKATGQAYQDILAWVQQEIDKQVLGDDYVPPAPGRTL